MSLEAIRYERGKLEILDQLLLPHETVYEKLININDGWDAIKKMKVRGAPAIAIVGCLSLAVDLQSKDFGSTDKLLSFIEASLDYLITARPTAVNISKSAKELKSYLSELVEKKLSTQEIKLSFIENIEAMLSKDVGDNKRLGDHGANDIKMRCRKAGTGYTILTHCNAGSLATAGYGTALGVVRSLHAQGGLEQCYCTETRPYNQGARLTAYELVHDKIPSTLIADSMVGLLMKTKKVSAVVVGADRVAHNGDVANKIGTYQIALLAKHHGVPFYVAAPVTCHDDVTATGDRIVIEERPPNELTMIGGVRIAAEGINCWNPAFDVTPRDLITGGIITEEGVFVPSQSSRFNKE